MTLNMKPTRIWPGSLPLVVTSAPASTLNRRLADLVADLPFPQGFRIPRIATLLDPSPQRPLRITPSLNPHGAVPYDYKDAVSVERKTKKASHNVVSPFPRGSRSHVQVPGERCLVVSGVTGGCNMFFCIHRHLYSAFAS
jgi:hypothetical protein